MTVFTSAGETLTRDRMVNATASVVTHGHWGTGTGAEAKANTALTTPRGEARQTVVVTTPTSGAIRWAFTMTATSNGTITEGAVFNAVTAGSMPVRSLFTGIPLETGDQVAFEYTLTYS